MKVQILEKATNQLVNALISPVDNSDLESVAWKENDRGRFIHFNWKDIGYPDTKELYKLEKDGIILGLVKFFHEDMIIKTIELNKIEVSIENCGRNKRYDYIAGCLIAYACLAAQSLSGKMYLFYKKATKKLYIDKYGMKEYDNFYVLSDKSNCEQLVSTYLNM